jgi:hypothetical protein
VAAGLAFGAHNARRDRFGIDTVFFAAVQTGDLHGSILLIPDLKSTNPPKAEKNA